MSWWNTEKTESKKVARCYESHPALKIGEGVLYGGNCEYPAIKKADIYVALQAHSSCGRNSDPWDEQKVVEIHYGIRDTYAPENVTRFKKMVNWLCTQLQAGKKVHVGCVGGHGRTGTVLAAIVAQCLGEKDAIQYVRKHYCEKAVESKEQVDFLMEHYGVSKAKPAKSFTSNVIWGGSSPSKDWNKSPSSIHEPFFPEPRLVKSDTAKTEVLRQILPENVGKSTRTFAPVESARCLWKRKR